MGYHFRKPTKGPTAEPEAVSATDVREGVGEAPSNRFRIRNLLAVVHRSIVALKAVFGRPIAHRRFIRLRAHLKPLFDCEDRQIGRLRRRTLQTARCRR